VVKLELTIKKIKINLWGFLSVKWKYPVLNPLQHYSGLNKSQEVSSSWWHIDDHLTSNTDGSLNPYKEAKW
jgi:hypothetical protein